MLQQPLTPQLCHIETTTQSARGISTKEVGETTATTFEPLQLKRLQFKFL
jgi:hypothetical protein